MNMKKVYAAVKALIKKEDKYLILKQRFNNQTCFDLPGGRVELGENPYETLVREVKEETFLDVEIVKPVGMWWFFRISDGSQVICNTFLCEAKSYDVDLTKNVDDEYIVGHYWLTKKEILELEEVPHPSFKEIFK